MRIQAVPAPSRVFKTWSMLLLMADGIFNLASVAANTLSEAQIIGHETSIIINTVFVFLIGASRFVAQNIQMTTKQKHDVVKAAAAQPMKPGSANIKVKMDNLIVPSTPKGVKP